MDANSKIIRSDFHTLICNLIFVFIGCILFLLRRHYSGPLEDIIHSYAGNFFVSFALYFVIINLLVQVQLRAKRVMAVLLTLAAVESFEAFNGNGFMANTYDPVDYIANALGVGSEIIVITRSTIAAA